MAERGFSQAGFPLVVAHRGASAEQPENTLAAFERAVVLGADAVEFDVRMTADDAPVVLHDPDVARTTAGTGLVRSMSLAEVLALGVPTLEEVLRQLSGRVGIDIEIKNIPGEPDFDAEREAVVEATLAALNATGFTGPVIVSSFNPFSIARSRALAPEIPTALLSDVTAEARAALTFARDHGHRWILPFIGRVEDAGASFPAEVHDAGLLVGTWITDDPAEAVRLMRSGVDAVATNDPAPILAARREALGG